MTLNSARSRSIVPGFTVVALAALLVGCASMGPYKPIEVSDVKSLAGTWKGVIYWSGNERDELEMTIREDGSYHFVAHEPVGSSEGNGKITISEGRLIIQGEKGQGVAELMSTGNGRVMQIEATLSDNRHVSARLWLTP